MKKIFIVLLVVAVGVGIYFYANHKTKIGLSNPKELIVGKWKVDSLIFKKDTTTFSKLLSHVFDSSINTYRVEFTKDNVVLTSHDAKVDTAHYELADNATLLISEGDNAEKERWDINKLDSSFLTARDKDSTIFYLRRLTTQ